jgi:hypothetical protein
MVRSRSPTVTPSFPWTGPTGRPMGASTTGSHVMILPCGHAIAVPDDVSPMMLPASVREHDGGCSTLPEPGARTPTGSGATPSYGIEYSPFARAAARPAP